MRCCGPTRAWSWKTSAATSPWTSRVRAGTPPSSAPSSATGMHQTKYAHKCVCNERVCRADLDHVDQQQRQALHKAARSGSEEVVRLLLDAGAFVDAEDNQCYTPLLLAEKHGHRAVVAQLLAANADVRCCSRSGDSVLWSALEGADVARVEKLIREHRLVRTHPALRRAPLVCRMHTYTHTHAAELMFK